MLKPEHYAHRRTQLLNALPINSVVLIPAASVAVRNRDVEYSYRQDSNMLYLTGFVEPRSVLVLSSLGGVQQHYLFCQPYDAIQAMWHGPMLGVAAAQAKLGIAQGGSIHDLAALWFQEFAEAAHFFAPKNLLPGCHWLDEYLPDQPSWQVVDEYMAQLRVIKTPEEIAITQHAVDVTVAAHRAVMQAARPGITEMQLYGVFLQELFAHGVLEQAYPAIVASGANACVLHYTQLQAKCHDQDLLLLDAGAEYLGYAADLTRTFPVSQKFSPAQRDLYQQVLNIQHHIIDHIKPGVSWAELNALTQQLSANALLELGILSAQLTDEVHQQLLRQLVPHGVGHWLGLDVHDVGFGAQLSRNDPLPDGSLLTIEPGIYIPPNMPDVPEVWHGLGVRIEDNIWFHQGQAVVLSQQLEKDIDAIESLCQS